MNDLTNNLFQSVYGSIVNLTNWAFNFYYNNVVAVQTILLIISGILLWFVIFFIIKLELVKNKLNKHMDVWGAVNLTKVTVVKFWSKILKRLATQDPEQMKKALIEADKIFDEMAKISGYAGHKMPTADERVGNFTEEQLPNLKEVMAAHNLSKKVKDNPDIELSYEEARNALKAYQKAFRDFGLLD